MSDKTAAPIGLEEAEGVLARFLDDADREDADRDDRGELYEALAEYPTEAIRTILKALKARA